MQHTLESKRMVIISRSYFFWLSACSETNMARDQSEGRTSKLCCDFRYTSKTATSIPQGEANGLFWCSVKKKTLRLVTMVIVRETLRGWIMLFTLFTS